MCVLLENKQDKRIKTQAGESDSFPIGSMDGTQSCVNVSCVKALLLQSRDYGLAGASQSHGRRDSDA
ncbi:MAG: hypothetical protein N2487_02005 [Verrucomicrobiae bacterium]|nr:hypothetical protein [Verrucomicrobiae bacterium]